MSTISENTTENSLPRFMEAGTKKPKPSALRASLVFIILATVVTGIIYPLAITGIAQLVFPVQANGSLLRDNAGTVQGSSLLAQDFSAARFFHARPSAANYVAAGGSASNQGPVSAKLQAQVQERKAAWQAEHGANAAVPADALYASGSGLDPEISLESAKAQLNRVALQRKLSAENRGNLERLILSLERSDGIPRVNVTVLNWSMERDERFQDGE